jgi:hypothetical protein
LGPWLSPGIASSARRRSVGAEPEEAIRFKLHGLRQGQPEQLLSSGLVRKCLSPVAPTLQTSL